MTGTTPSSNVAVEQQPRVGALLRRFGQRAVKRESAAVDEVVCRRDDARVLRLIQIQAARVVAGAHAKAIEANVLQRAARGQVHRIAPGRVVEIVNDRQQRLDQQRISSTARMTIEQRRRFVALERFDRDDDERREGDERDAQHASRRPVRRVAPSEPPHRPQSVSVKRAPAPAAQPRPTPDTACATSDSAPAPKNPATRGTTPSAVPASSTTTSTAGGDSHKEGRAAFYVIP